MDLHAVLVAHCRDAPAAPQRQSDANCGVDTVDVLGLPEPIHTTGRGVFADADGGKLQTADPERVALAVEDSGSRCPK